MVIYADSHLRKVLRLPNQARRNGQDSPSYPVVSGSVSPILETGPPKKVANATVRYGLGPEGPLTVWLVPGVRSAHSASVEWPRS